MSEKAMQDGEYGIKETLEGLDDVLMLDHGEELVIESGVLDLCLTPASQAFLRLAKVGTRFGQLFSGISRPHFSKST